MCWCWRGHPPVFWPLMLTEVFNDYRMSIEVQKRVKQRVSGVYEEHRRPAWGVLIFLRSICPAVTMLLPLRFRFRKRSFATAASKSGATGKTFYCVGEYLVIPRIRAGRQSLELVHHATLKTLHLVIRTQRRRAPVHTYPSFTTSALASAPPVVRSHSVDRDLT